MYWRRIRQATLCFLSALALVAFSTGPASAVDVSEEEFIASLQANLRDARSLIRGMSIREIVLVSEVDEMGATQLLRSNMVINPDGTRYGTLEGDGRVFRTVCPRKKRCFLKVEDRWIRVPDKLDDNALTPKLIATNPLEGITPESLVIEGRTFRAVGADGFLVVTLGDEGVEVSARQTSDGALLEARSKIDYLSPRTVSCQRAKAVTCVVRKDGRNN